MLKEMEQSKEFLSLVSENYDQDLIRIGLYILPPGLKLSVVHPANMIRMELIVSSSRWYKLIYKRYFNNIFVLYVVLSNREEENLFIRKEVLLLCRRGTKTC